MTQREELSLEHLKECLLEFLKQFPVGLLNSVEIPEECKKEFLVELLSLSAFDGIDIFICKTSMLVLRLSLSILGHAHCSADHAPSIVLSPALHFLLPTGQLRTPTLHNLHSCNMPFPSCSSGFGHSSTGDKVYIIHEEHKITAFRENRIPAVEPDSSHHTIQIYVEE